MPATLTPLPSPSPGLAARIVKAPAWKLLPASNPVDSAPAFPALAALPSWPNAPVPAQQVFPTSWPPPLTVLPFPVSTQHPVSPFHQEIPTYAPIPSEPLAAAPPPPAFEPAKIVETPDFTDEDLLQALSPILEHTLRSAGYPKENSLDNDLEPMLRATIRRALAEYSPASRPFRAPAALDRFVWHLQALFTSRTYEDILFEKTHRFQVDEVFLVDVATLALVSFASCDPARHSSAKRVNGTVQRLAMQLRDDDGKVREFFDLADQRNAIARAGQFVILLAIVRGQPSELVLTDLEFALRRIEDRFREQFQQHGSPLLHALQPFLEDCLLIQAPASAA